MLRLTGTRPRTRAVRRTVVVRDSKPKQTQARPRLRRMTGFKPHPNPGSPGRSRPQIARDDPGQLMHIHEVRPGGPQKSHGADGRLKHSPRDTTRDARFPAAPQNRGQRSLADVAVSSPGGGPRGPIVLSLPAHALHLQQVRADPATQLKHLVGAMPMLRPKGEGPNPEPGHRGPSEDRQLHPRKATLHSSQIHHHHPGGVNLGRTSAGPATTASWRRPLLNSRVNHPGTPKQAAKGGAPQLARGFPTRGPRPDQNDSGLPALGRGDDHRINSIKVAEPGHQQLAPQRRGATPRREGGHQVRGGNLLATPIAHDFQ